MTQPSFYQFLKIPEMYCSSMSLSKRQTKTTESQNISTRGQISLYLVLRNQYMPTYPTSSFPQLSLMTKRSEILRMDKAVAKETRQLKQLEKIIERDNLNFETFLRENERKSVEARTL